MSVDLVMQSISLLVYGVLLLGAVRFWWAQAVRAAAWLVATFAILAAIALLAVLTPADVVIPDTGRFAIGRIFTDVVIVALVLFPYFLHRFVRSLRQRVTRFGRVVDASVVVLSVWTITLPHFPAPGQPQPGWWIAYRTTFVVWWFVVLLGVAVSLWRAGRGQPGVARRRMRSMAAAALSLSLALLVSTAGQDRSAVAAQVALIASSLLGWLSAAGFLVGFAPPTALRQLWRAEDEASLRRCSAAIPSARTAKEAAALIVHPISAMLGGQAAVILDIEGHPLAASGAELPDPLAEHSDRMVIVGRNSRLVIERSRHAPLFGEDEELLVTSIGSYLDVCLDRLAAFEVSENARLNAERSSAELQQLVYGISHDLKNPLHTVIGFLGLLDHESSHLSEEGRMFLNRIQASTSYMTRLIDDLLALSRVGQVDAKPAVVGLRELIDDIGTGIQEQYEGVTVRCAEDDALWMNPIRARQLFTNLLENAARHGVHRPLAIEIQLGSRDGHLLEILVQDNGVGIPEAFRERVFSIFERLEGFDTTKGTGVGLTMCRRIVEDVGGSISITETPAGCQFRLKLPLSSVPSPRPPLRHELGVQHA